MSLHDDDDFRSLRRTRDEVAPASTEALNRGRAALLERASAGVPTTAPEAARPRRTRWALAGTAVAAVAAGALVLANITGIGGGGGASAEATEVLENASLAALGAVNPVVGESQYLLVMTDAEYLGGWSASTGDDPAAQVFGAFPEHDEVYIPADDDAEAVWVREFDYPSRYWGDGAEALIRSEPVRAGSLQRGVAGKLHNVLGEKLLDVLPREGGALLAYFDAEYTGASSSYEEDMIVRISEVLRAGNAPADLRAAGYQALTRLDGVEVIEQAVTLDGRTGVAIGRVEPSRGERYELVIDPSTGQLIGERTVTVEDRLHIPAGTVTSWTSVTISVVDEAP